MWIDWVLLNRTKTKQLKRNTMENIRLTTAQLADKSANGYNIYINGKVKSCLQLRNMKGKLYNVTMAGDNIIGINVQMLNRKQQ